MEGSRQEETAAFHSMIRRHLRHQQGLIERLQRGVAQEEDNGDDDEEEEEEEETWRSRDRNESVGNQGRKRAPPFAMEHVSCENVRLAEELAVSREEQRLLQVRCDALREQLAQADKKLEFVLRERDAAFNAQEIAQLQGHKDPGRMQRTHRVSDDSWQREGSTTHPEKIQVVCEIVGDELGSIQRAMDDAIMHEEIPESFALPVTTLDLLHEPFRQLRGFLMPLLEEFVRLRGAREAVSAWEKRFHEQRLAFLSLKKEMEAVQQDMGVFLTQWCQSITDVLDSDDELPPPPKLPETPSWNAIQTILNDLLTRVARDTQARRNHSSVLCERLSVRDREVTELYEDLRDSEEKMAQLKDDMEAEFTTALEDLHSQMKRVKTMQEDPRKMYDEITAARKEKENLQERLNAGKEEVSRCKMETSHALRVCSTLVRALLPLQRRLQELVHQKRVLGHQVHRMETLQGDVSNLMQAMLGRVSPSPHSQASSATTAAHHVSFRGCVIAILAAQRLRILPHLGRYFGVSPGDGILPLASEAEVKEPTPNLVCALQQCPQSEILPRIFRLFDVRREDSTQKAPISPLLDALAKGFFSFRVRRSQMALDLSFPQQRQLIYEEDDDTRLAVIRRSALSIIKRFRELNEDRDAIQRYCARLLEAREADWQDIQELKDSSARDQQVISKLQGQLKELESVSEALVQADRNDPNAQLSKELNDRDEELSNLFEALQIRSQELELSGRLDASVENVLKAQRRMMDASSHEIRRQETRNEQLEATIAALREQIEFQSTKGDWSRTEEERLTYQRVNRLLLSELQERERTITSLREAIISLREDARDEILLLQAAHAEEEREMNFDTHPTSPISTRAVAGSRSGSRPASVV